MCTSIPQNQQMQVAGENPAPPSQNFPIQETAAPPVDTMDFSGKNNTTLNPAEETKFQQWAAKTGKGKDIYNYDIKGAWKELQKGTMSADERGHLGDKYKKPNHPTFSDESVYHGKDGNVGGKWGREGKAYTYTPSSTNMWHPDDLAKYFNEREKGVKLKQGKR